MHSASLKRGRLTARLGRLETLPGAPDSLKKQIAKKEELLAKLCTQYESLVKTSEEKKLSLELAKKHLLVAQSSTKEIEQTRKRLEAVAHTPGLSPEPVRRKREAVQQENEGLQTNVEKNRRKMKNLQQKHEKEQSEFKMRKEQLARWEVQEKELVETVEKDEKEAQELENFISRLSESLFERQRKYEEMLIADPSDFGNAAGLEKKIREERRRLLRERQMIEEKWPRGEEGENDFSNSSSPGIQKDLDKIADQWIKTMDELLFSDVKLSEQEAMAHGLITRTHQVEAAMRLLQMKKDPTMYTAYNHREESGNKVKKEHMFDSGVRVPEFKKKMKDFIQREQALNKAFLGDSTQDVDGSYWEHLEDVQKENQKRKQMMQHGEQWARQKLVDELGTKMRVAEKLQHEVDTAESIENKLKKNLQTKKQEVRNEEKKKENAERRRRQRKMDQEQARRKVESLRRQNVEQRQKRVMELRQQRHEAETKRRQINNEITVVEREMTDTRAALHVLRSRLHDDTPELQKTVEFWRTRVQELKTLEEDLRKMLAEATRTNQEAKEQLAVVKPYQAEQQEMDYLLEQEKQLDRQLKEVHKQQEAEITFPEAFR